MIYLFLLQRELYLCLSGYLSLRPWIEIQSLLKTMSTFLLTSRHPCTHPGSSAGLHPPEEETAGSCTPALSHESKCWRGHSWGLNQSSALLLSPPSSSHSFKGIRVEPMSLNLFLFFSTHTFYTSFFFFFPFSKKKKPFQVTAI